jgi:multisubunit Na+/H+ antiporter MnhB subunit
MAREMLDAVLGLAVLWVAWSALNSRDLFRGVVLFIAFGLLMALIWARLQAPDIALGESGVSHPVTAVLLNFRGYDTLLEVAVLLLALIGTWSVGTARGCGGTAPGPLLLHLPRLLMPLMVLVAGYLLWVGAHAPGGAFQAGALLGAVAILGCLSGRRLPALVLGWPLRLALILGVGVFAALGVGVAALPGGAPLEWPPAIAKHIIVGIELAAMLSIGAVLGALFVGGRP